jgi:hypothetical protein
MYCFLDNCMVQPGPAKITGFVKCVDKPNEDGINGVTMRLCDAAGNLLATTLTHNQSGLDGYYEFANLAPGTYQIHLVDVPPAFNVGGVVMLPLNVFRSTPGTINGVPVGTGRIER